MVSASDGVRIRVTDHVGSDRAKGQSKPAIHSACQRRLHNRATAGGASIRKEGLARHGGVEAESAVQHDDIGSAEEPAAIGAPGGWRHLRRWNLPIAAARLVAEKS